MNICISNTLLLVDHGRWSVGRRDKAVEVTLAVLLLNRAVDGHCDEKLLHGTTQRSHNLTASPDKANDY